MDDPHLEASVLHRELVDAGFGRAYTTLVGELRRLELRPVCLVCAHRRGDQVTTEIDHPAGEEIQWDWLELAAADVPWGEAAYVLVGALAHSGRFRGVFCEGKLRQPTEFGTVMQVAELCENTRRGARGLIVPLATTIGSPNEHELLKQTGARLRDLDLRPREVALDGGFAPGPVAENLPPTDRAFIAARQSAGSKKTNRRLAKFRVGCEGRISHLKRRYGLRRSRLKGHHGARTWAAWAVLAYNLETLAIRTA